MRLDNVHLRVIAAVPFKPDIIAAGSVRAMILNSIWWSRNSANFHSRLVELKIIAVIALTDKIFNEN